MGPVGGINGNERVNVCRPYIDTSLITGHGYVTSKIRGLSTTGEECFFATETQLSICIYSSAILQSVQYGWDGTEGSNPLKDPVMVRKMITDGSFNTCQTFSDFGSATRSFRFSTANNVNSMYDCVEGLEVAVAATMIGSSGQVGGFTIHFGSEGIISTGYEEYIDFLYFTNDSGFAVEGSSALNQRAMDWSPNGMFDVGRVYSEAFEKWGELPLRLTEGFMFRDLDPLCSPSDHDWGCRPIISSIEGDKESHAISIEWVKAPAALVTHLCYEDSSISTNCNDWISGGQSAQYDGTPYTFRNFTHDSSFFGNSASATNFPFGDRCTGEEIKASITKDLTGFKGSSSLFALCSEEEGGKCLEITPDQKAYESSANVFRSIINVNGYDASGCNLNKQVPGFDVNMNYYEWGRNASAAYRIKQKQGVMQLFELTGISGESLTLDTEALVSDCVMEKKLPLDSNGLILPAGAEDGLCRYYRPSDEASDVPFYFKPVTLAGVIGPTGMTCIDRSDVYVVNGIFSIWFWVAIGAASAIIILLITFFFLWDKTRCYGSSDDYDDDGYSYWGDWEEYVYDGYDDYYGNDYGNGDYWDYNY